MPLHAGLTIAVAAAVLGSPAAAQDRPRVWLGLGAGGGGGQGAAGAGLMAELVFQKRVHHFAVRGVLLIDPYESGGTIGELGVLYGRVAKRPWGHAALAGGVAYTSVDPCPEATGRCTTVGVPIWPRQRCG